MTAPSPLPQKLQTTVAKPFARPRRVKRGIVAGYIHDISPRHRTPSTPLPTSASSAPALEQHQA
jgi:hypothetical protein